MAPNAEAVKVVVRCRPLSSQEVEDRRAVIVQVDEARNELQIAKEDGTEPRTFTFDQVYGMTSTQEQIFQRTAQPILDSCIEGYNGTIFAYGQTGAGKSFTMEGKDEPAELRGIIPSAFNYIFSQITAKDGGANQFVVYISYLEIYNEELRDLLAPAPTGPAAATHRGPGPVAAKAHLELKESKERGVFVKDLQQFAVKSVEEANKRLAVGRKHRHVGAHAMNAESSRSHSILTIALVAVEKLTAANVKSTDHKMHVGKLNLVDLAGSERQGKTQATGDRLKEGSAINQSLSALGNVISALVDAKAGSHVPYRDSKLTRLLQDALGGNTKTVMVANVGPAGWNFDETMGTLRYASRAKKISNKPRVNNSASDSSVAQYVDEIAKLKNEYAAQIVALKAEHEAQVELLRAQFAGEAGKRTQHSMVIRELRAELDQKGAAEAAASVASSVPSADALAAARAQVAAEMADQLATQVAQAKAEALKEAKAAAQIEIKAAQASAVAATQAQAAAEAAAAKATAASHAQAAASAAAAAASQKTAAEVTAKAASEVAAARAEAAQAASQAGVAQARAQAAAVAQAQAAVDVSAARAQAEAAQAAAATAAAAATLARDTVNSVAAARAAAEAGQAAAHQAAQAKAQAEAAEKEKARLREADGAKVESQTQLSQLQALLASLQAKGAGMDAAHHEQVARLMAQVESLQARSAAENAKYPPVTGRSMRADQGFTELFETLVLDMQYDPDASREAILCNPHSTLDEIIDYIAAHADIMASWRHLKSDLEAGR